MEDIRSCKIHVVVEVSKVGSSMNGRTLLTSILCPSILYKKKKKPPPCKTWDLTQLDWLALNNYVKLGLQSSLETLNILCSSFPPSAISPLISCPTSTLQTETPFTLDLPRSFSLIQTVSMSSAQQKPCLHHHALSSHPGRSQDHRLGNQTWYDHVSAIFSSSDTDADGGTDLSTSLSVLNWVADGYWHRVCPHQQRWEPCNKLSPMLLGVSRQF